MTTELYTKIVWVNEPSIPGNKTIGYVAQAGNSAYGPGNNMVISSTMNISENDIIVLFTCLQEAANNITITSIEDNTSGSWNVRTPITSSTRIYMSWKQASNSNTTDTIRVNFSGSVADRATIHAIQFNMNGIAVFDDASNVTGWHAANEAFSSGNIDTTPGDGNQEACVVGMGGYANMSNLTTHNIADEVGTLGNNYEPSCKVFYLVRTGSENNIDADMVHDIGVSTSCELIGIKAT